MNFIMRWLRKYYLEKSGKERISPNDWVKRDQIKYDGKAELLTIKLKPVVKIFSIADTNSMDGLLDIGHNVVATDEFDRSKLAVGDIVIYQIHTTKVVHRIVEITEDEGGRIYRCKGDNNVDVDKWLLRDEHIIYLVLMVIY